MEFKVIQKDILDLSGDALVIPAFEDATINEPALMRVDKVLEGVISALKQKGEIKGKQGEQTVIFSLGRVASSKIVISGLGKKNAINLEKIRIAAADTARALRKKGSQIINYFCPVALEGISDEDLGQAIVEGVSLGTYSFRRHITQPPEEQEIKEFNLVIEANKSRSELEMGVQAGKIISEAVILARDLANEPANHMNPSELAKAALEVATKYGIFIQIFEKEEIQKLKMGGLLGVSQGSIQPPRFIIMNFRGRESDTIDIALLGKGITFDSGGISLKPSEGMGEMKGDMAGGADVIAAMGAIARLKPKINVLGIVPATENMPGGSALKPGDIITIMNGKTVEIISTDAEGRLILADALCYAQKLGAKRMVDVATLTGSCHIALGDVCSGTFGNNQDFIDLIIEAGQETGECLWQLPMNDEYRNLNRSDVADIKNTGGRYGGAIAAAWFLREFVEDVPWIHLDIAGTSTVDKERGYLIKGNTGVPVRTLIRLVLKLAKSAA